MRLLIQRVTKAQVTVGPDCIGKINQGLLVLIGISKTDTPATIPNLVKKLLQLRIFNDKSGKPNINILDQKGSILVVSQFTLYADCKKGNRPSYTNAAGPEEAHNLYLEFIKQLKLTAPELHVQTGQFAADMKVSLLNDGPMTIWIDSDQ